MGKGRATVPSPQNRQRRAAFFIKRDHEPHAKAELLKLAIDQETKQRLRGIKKG